MTSNPIQRKTRNSFLLGMLIMLLIAVAIFAILYFTVFADIFSKPSAGKGGAVYAYRLTAEVKSGEKLEANKVELVKLNASDVPTDYAGNDINITLYKSKLDLQEGTVLSNSLLYENEEVENSTRLIEYNMLTLPSSLSVGDYIDVRFTVPSGQNFIVLSKKQVVSLKNTTVGMYLTEDEILMMSGAIIESYIMKASNLQAVQYVQAGTQNASTPTYAINADVYELMKSNAAKINIEDYSKINDSYSDSLRAIIEQELTQYIGKETTNIQEGIEKEKETSMELYLSGLQGY